MNEQASYYFHQGSSTHAYEYLGCHSSFGRDGITYTFRVWAPNAQTVELVGDFTGWETPIPMQRVTQKGVFECIVHPPSSIEGKAYKFLVTGADGVKRYKGDPYAFRSRGKDDGASLVCTESRHTWHDKAWMTHRKKTVSDRNGYYLATPMNIYEVHAGSFLRHKDTDRYYSYRELAEVLVPYVKHMGFTHIEFLPLAEFPFDGSWGYQVGAFYAPTSRFGSPDDFRFLVDECHKAGIGVLLDWVPAHFPKDAWGLYEFDGQPLYEYQGRDRMESSSWGTRFFDLGREEVQSFLISNALFFLREYHIDGLRVDAVASMLYLDFARRPGEWVPNVNGGRENLEAIAFIKKLNGALLSEFPDALMIAEESTAFPGVTAPVANGGLGFSLKGNMGWANDFYDYLSGDPLYRKYRHSALTFPLMYAFSENYILPISHDEVVHGKRSFVDKMYGSYADKFRQARTALMLQMTYPGKKMLFMGTEFAQFREWDFAGSLEWFMLDYPMHSAFRDYTAALGHFYLSHGELWEIDFRPEGFQWILADENEKNTVAFRRRDASGNSLTVILCFSGTSQTVTFPIRYGTVPKLLFSTDDAFSLPDGCTVESDVETVLTLTLPKFTGVILKEETHGRNFFFKRPKSPKDKQRR